MLLEHKIKIYDACRICQQLMKKKTMVTFSLHMKSMQRMFQIHPKKPGYQFRVL